MVVTAAIGAAQRDGERQRHSGQRRMHARFQHQHPQHRAEHDIGRERAHIHAVEDSEDGEHAEGVGEPSERQVAV